MARAPHRCRIAAGNIAAMLEVKGTLHVHAVQSPHFVKGALTAGALAGLGDFAFLGRLPPIDAADGPVAPDTVRFGPEVEPLVRLIEDTPQEKLLDAAAAKIHDGDQPTSGCSAPSSWPACATSSRGRSASSSTACWPSTPPTWRRWPRRTPTAGCRCSGP